MSVTLIIDFKAKPERSGDFLALLANAKQQLPGSHGCRDICVLQELDDPTAVRIVETWTSKAAHQAYFETLIASGGWDAVRAHLRSDPVSAYCAEL